MKTAVLKLGDELGITFPKNIAEILDLSENDKIEITEHHDGIYIEKIPLTLDDLFADYDGNEKSEPYDFSEEPEMPNFIGILSKYANPDLIPLEKEAWGMAMEEKHGFN
ncbi:MAG: AbrB/MazE/SpoVT family DNA-binding domain-containing protein [Firmicutes bacterium]|nr:AbrB/MazE/SpoVT family DNA-binding domain-containing protein [Bacillota bacterium]